MTAKPASSPLQMSFITSLAVNGLGLVFACSVMALGFVGAGMSSQPPEELRKTWYSFVWLAFCCPAALNLGLLAFTAWQAARQREARAWLGWLGGLAVAGIPLCLLAVFSALIGGG